MTRAPRWALLLGAVALSSCAGRGPFRTCCPAPCRPVQCSPASGAPTTAHPVATAPAPWRPTLADWPAPGTIVDQRDGSTVSFDAMMVRLGTASAVYVGEGHDQAEHHRFQARVFEAMAAQPGGPLALGMEMFSKPSQAALDAYVRKEIDEATMLERTEWKTRWGFGWDMYAPMVRLCRERGFPVVALNAPREITSTVSKKGLEGLTPEQRATLPPLDLGDEAHRKATRAAFGSHGATMKPETFDRFYTAQVIWEETMSSSVADWLKSAGPGARMMVVAGGFHVGNRFGIPARAAKKSGVPYLTVVASTLPSANDLSEATREDLPKADVAFADYVAWFVESAPPKPKPPATPAAAGKPAAAP